MASPHPNLRLLDTVEGLDRWLRHVQDGRCERHLLISGPPGKGKTLRLLRHFRPLTAADHPTTRHIADRLAAPLYGGRVTPAKWFIRGWQHQDDPLLILNDLHIRPTDMDWESMLCQFLEISGEREIRWDLRSAIGLSPADREEILRWFREHGLPRSLQRRDEDGGDESWRASLPELNLWEEMEQATKQGVLAIPSHYTTCSQVVLVANSLGKGWDRIYSRLRGFWYDPTTDSLLEDMARWSPPVPPIILKLLRDWHRRGEIFNLDLRKIAEAIEDLRLGEDWESNLARSFLAEGDETFLMDVEGVLDWLRDRRAKEGGIFTESQLYHDLQQFRPDRRSGNERRHRALEYLIAEEIVERCWPARRPGVARGRSPGRGFQVLKMPP